MEITFHSFSENNFGVDALVEQYQSILYQNLSTNIPWSVNTEENTADTEVLTRLISRIMSPVYCYQSCINHHNAIHQIPNLTTQKPFSSTQYILFAKWQLIFQLKILHASSYFKKELVSIFHQSNTVTNFKYDHSNLFQILINSLEKQIFNLYNI